MSSCLDLDIQMFCNKKKNIYTNVLLPFSYKCFGFVSLFDNFITLSECALIISFFVYFLFIFKKNQYPKNYKKI